MDVDSLGTQMCMYGNTFLHNICYMIQNMRVSVHSHQFLRAQLCTGFWTIMLNQACMYEPHYLLHLVASSPRHSLDSFRFEPFPTPRVAALWSRNTHSWNWIQRTRKRLGLRTPEGMWIWLAMHWPNFHTSQIEGFARFNAAVFLLPFDFDPT